MKSILKCEDYATPSARGTGEGGFLIRNFTCILILLLVFVPVQVLQAQKSVADFFHNEQLKNILEQIVTDFMLITSEVFEEARREGGREQETDRQKIKYYFIYMYVLLLIGFRIVGPVS